MTFQHLPRWPCRGPTPPQKSFTCFFGDSEQGSGFHANFVCRILKKHEAFSGSWKRTLEEVVGKEAMLKEAEVQRKATAKLIYLQTIKQNKIQKLQARMEEVA